MKPEPPPPLSDGRTTAASQAAEVATAVAATVCTTQASSQSGTCTTLPTDMDAQLFPRGKIENSTGIARPNSLPSLEN